MLWVFKLRQLCWQVLSTRVPVATRHNRALPPSNEDPGTRRAWSGFLAKFLGFNTGPSIELWITPPSTNNSTQKHGKTYIDKQDCIGPMPDLGFVWFCLCWILNSFQTSGRRDIYIYILTYERRSIFTTGWDTWGYPLVSYHLYGGFLEIWWNMDNVNPG